MNSNSNQTIVYRRFLDTFCIRIDQIPMINSNSECFGQWPFLPTNYLGEEMTYITHEGYLNFNVSGVTYLTRDCEDVRKYLESLGYKRSYLKKSVILAAYYNVDDMGIIYPIDSHIFRLFFGLSLVDNFSPTIKNGNIGRNEQEIEENIEKATRDDPIFNDQLWKESKWRKFHQIQKDEMIYKNALKYINKCINQLGYKNVYISELLENPNDIVKIINYWQMAHGLEPKYTLSETYIKYINHSIKKDKEKNKSKLLNEPNYGILINQSDEEIEDISMLYGDSAICHSQEELWNALYKLLDSPTKKPR